MIVSVPSTVWPSVVILDRPDSLIGRMTLDGRQCDFTNGRFEEFRCIKASLAEWPLRGKLKDGFGSMTVIESRFTSHV